MLEHGPAAVEVTGASAWQHDGHRMHLAGHGTQLESVRAGSLVMDEIRSGRGDALLLHADRAETRRSGKILDRWATALEIPLFIWERTEGGVMSWTTPLSAGGTGLNDTATRLVLRSQASGERLVFEASSGRVAVADDNRITWTAEGPGRLVAIAAMGDADLDRSLDLLNRRTLPGLGRQRAQHAEQLQRGGAALRAATIPGLADAFDWAKVRADALLGAWIAGDRVGLHGPAVHRLLAEGLLAAGLSQLPRALRRQLDTNEGGDPAEYSKMIAAWTGELPGGSDSARSGRRQERERERPADGGHEVIPGSHAIATGQVDASGIASVLAGAIRSLWGVVPDAQRGVVQIAPDLAQLGGSAALSRLRIGRTVLDVRLRWRGEVVSIAIRRGAGPPIAVDCALRSAEVGELLVDGQAVTGSRARFEVRDAHDLQMRLLGGPPLSSAPS
ncbi:MAG TPA: hypothetical protein VFT04_15120 [Gemmatimonadales bacterium]|nr:hypothetical protein [Gemmatimonadales bacterium]